MACMASMEPALPHYFHNFEFWPHFATLVIILTIELYHNTPQIIEF
jgi:hypothetical protein